MTIVRYAPWAQGNRFQAELKNVFDNFFGESNTDQSSVVTSQWTPRVDIREEDKRFVILADIPGVEPRDIEVSMDKGVLSIKGERKSEIHEDNGKCDARRTFVRRLPPAFRAARQRRCRRHQRERQAWRAGNLDSEKSRDHAAQDRNQTLSG